MFDAKLKGQFGAVSLLAVALLSACGGGSGGGSAARPTNPNAFEQSVPFAPTPDKDPFFHQPLNFPDMAPGSILQFREIQFKPAGVPMSNKAWQIQFVTRDVNGNPIAATAAVVKPLTPPANGNSPLVAYNFYYNSLGADCVPSKSATGVGPTNSEWPLILPGLQTLGWTVVFTDYLGPFHSYAAGKLAGQVTLDALRAAAQFEPLGLNKQTPMGIWGYSGGAIATAWAASLQPTYAPELNLKGFASGGTPASPDSVIQNADTDPAANAIAFALTFSVVQGINRSYPQMITSILNDKGRASFNSQRDGCGGGTSDGSSGPTGKLADYVTVPKPFETPGMKEVTQLNRLPQPGLSPKASAFVYHEILDELVPIRDPDAMVAKWCQDGTPVTYQRGLQGEHVSGAFVVGPIASAWLNNTMNSQPAVALPTATRCN